MSSQLKNINYKPLYNESEIKARVKQLGDLISRDLKGEELVVIVVLKGAFMFAADLIREIKLPVIVDFIGCASYNGTKTTGTVKITQDLSTDITDKNILLVEDIVDTGRTLDYLVRILNERRPKSLRLCTLLNKPEAREIDVKVDYFGFSISKEFVIGYGLDLDQRFREISYIAQVQST